MTIFVLDCYQVCSSAGLIIISTDLERLKIHPGFGRFFL
jgi:hypothetical protein